MSALVTQDLSLCFKETRALDRVSVDIPENCIVGLIGRNGAGKTTLLKTTAGFLRPTSGQIKVFGEAPFDRIDTLSSIFYMDDDRYEDSLKVMEILTLSRLYYKNFNLSMAQKLLDYFEISIKSQFKKLSKGTKTLLSVVMAICSRSKLTMLDEPTLGLDASHRKEFMTLVLKDYSDCPRTFIISSHLISELEGMMEQVVLIDRGRIIFQKALEEVQNYALYLSGSKKILEKLVTQKTILTREEMGEHLTLGIENTLSQQELNQLRSNGIDISPMDVQDVCVNLTQIHNGGVLNAIK